MGKKMIAFLAASLFLLPGLAAAVTEEDFFVDTTENLINLCSVSPKDPLYQQAINFCHGYVVGAYDYYLASEKGPKGKKWVCMPDPPPSRNKAIERFVKWAKAHPQYRSEEAVETVFRFLMETWPCNP
jgi:hypothetical protein